MTREQQGQHLVADLRVVEAGAVGVAGLDQQPEHVLAGVGGAAATGDLAEDQPIEGSAHAPQAGERASGAAEDLEEVLALIEGEPALEGGGDVDPGAIGVEAEQGPHRHPHGHVPGPVVEVDQLAGPPAGRGALRLLAHHLGGGRDPLPVKDRHHRLPGPIVVLAVGGQKAVADQRDQVAEVAVAPAKPVPIGDQDEPVRLRAEHEHLDPVEDPNREDRPVLLVGGQEHRERIAPHALGEHQARELGTRGQRPPAGGAPLDPEVVADAQQRVGGGRLRNAERHRGQHTLAGWPDWGAWRRRRGTGWVRECGLSTGP